MSDKSALVILAPGFEEIEALAPVDILRRAGVAVTLAGLGGPQVKGAHDILVAADIALDQVGGRLFDAVLLPGGMPGSQNLAESASVRALVLAHWQAEKIVAGICAAPALALSAFGILNGRRATCYPGCERYFAAGVNHVAEAVVTDGRLVTANGPGAALAYAFELVRLLVSAEIAAKLRGQMQVQP